MAESMFGKLADQAARRGDPDEREKLLTRALRLVNADREKPVSVAHPDVLAVARFLAGEPG